MPGRSITIRILLLLSAFGFFLVGCADKTATGTEATNTPPVNAQTGDTTLSIDGTVYTRTNTEGVTVLALLEDVATAEGITLDIKEFSGGKFVNGIGDKNSDSGEGYWIYYVNGQPASVGVAEYVLRKGDKVEFKFE
ncbi:MAG: hypothetical protein A3F54_04925 [Candidatus Kerfeldbacteria bacterium RIFCSPHIGHO2_12_FULL_48_17]|uniref:Transcobalamin-like C-terminal domain-containing protein n=1 Tax=Candidatus Kerfeldbacteria bacterium RIFCSPHIGHO2_12_FULL_48_17 TaxID=1798542 RepID=A0A1G2B3F5_9BACT|nr:MAG: hypothetical protein A3F54_04925 [Candidatus Kerfeldbacteria bacterium RIFCSPHIGHO2_12_FULL_48_17]